MRRFGSSAFFVLVALLLLPAPLLAAGNVNFTYGTRSMQDDAWDDFEIDSQTVYGVTADFGGDNWPVNVAVGYYHSSDDGTLATFPILGAVDIDGDLSEWSLGAHKVWKLSNPARPFLGGGVTFLDAEAKVDSAFGDADDDDSTTGLYLEGGVFFRLAGNLNLGLSGRIVEGTDVTLFDVDGDADYYQVGLLFGFGWPASK